MCVLLQQVYSNIVFCCSVVQ